ncbi:MAG: helix-turn-helix transcriptional regulator [Gemmatimonadota bacterium]
MGRNGIGELEQLVLLALLRLGNDTYGGAVRRELARAAGRDVVLSTVYVTLMRLEEKGFVSSWMGEPTSKRGGKARRHFRVEPDGVAAAREARDTLLRMWDGVDASSARA